MFKKWLSMAMVVGLIAPTAQAQTIKVDERIMPYQKVCGISGNASGIGSDTMKNMMAMCLKVFR